MTKRKTLQPYQQRVVDEKDELISRIDKLREFMHGTEFPELPGEEQERMARQLNAMSAYHIALEERIAAFE